MISDVRNRLAVARRRDRETHLAGVNPDASVVDPDASVFNL